MATKVFISWSGELGRKLGEALRNWLPAALQYVRPYFSPDDIEKGARWDSEIAKELESSDVGVICLTQDNTQEPWILFEAGALSKSLDKARVCTLLFALDPTDVDGPLASFQATKFAREDFKRLVTTINGSAGEAQLQASVLDSVFEMWWPRLEHQISEILTSDDKGPQKKRRTERDILEEILALTRMNTERPYRPSGTSRQVIEGLLGTILEVARSSPMGYSTLRRLDRRILRLCHEAGVPELYDSWTLRTRLEGREIEAAEEETRPAMVNPNRSG